MYGNFRLTDNFLQDYKNRMPNWGFGELGKFVYRRTYSRKLENGKYEEWWETVKRVVEGCYSIQASWCQRNGLPFNYMKAQYSAQKMYDLIFTMKFLPPGRGLEHMGNPALTVKGGGILQNCFSADTEFITQYGIQKLGDLDDVDSTVLDKNGQFRLAQIRSFGVQNLNEVTFAPKGLRTNYRQTVKVTENHRWFLTDGSITESLQIGDFVSGSVVRNHNKESQEYIDGFAHGIIFGDGTAVNAYPTRHFVRLCGKKNIYADMLAKASGYRTTSSLSSYNNDLVVTIIGNTPYCFKELPETLSLDYICGFVEGWLAANSLVELSGSLVLSTQNNNAVKWLLKNAALAGYSITGLNSDSVMQTNFGTRSDKLQRVSLVFGAIDYEVVDIKEGVSTEEVFCAVEPITTSFTLGGGIATGNCAFVSTGEMEYDPTRPFTFMMDFSALGVGVGFDTKGENYIVKGQYEDKEEVFIIPDSREGWVESLRILLASHFLHKPRPKFDYSQIRASGSTLQTLGGTASGPGPLKEMHEAIDTILKQRKGKRLGSTAIVDMQNWIGRCIVSGGTRRSSQIVFGSPLDDDYINLKNPSLFSDELKSHRWASNNSIFAEVGMDYTPFVNLIQQNGEPGFIWLDNARHYGRMADGYGDWDMEAMGCNPCSEQVLTHEELCNLCEVFPAHHDSLDDLRTTLKFAYLYAKTVTLVPTHDPTVNAVIGRNRRIGTSMSGIAQAIHKFGYRNLMLSFNNYYKYLRQLDIMYSRWLCVPTSIKISTVKPSGTVSLVAGATPGVHFPHSEFYIRRVRVQEGSPFIDACKKAGYTVEKSVYGDNTYCIEFPIKEENFLYSKNDISIYQQVNLVSDMQRYWSDNSVSVTCTVRPEEMNNIKDVLETYEDKLKSISFLPLMDHTYEQAPYETINREQYENRIKNIKKIRFNETVKEASEKFCDGEACAIN